MSKVITMFYDLIDKDSGDLLESNKNQEPISFITGRNQVLEKLEERILELGAGDKATIIITPEDGLGDYDNSLIRSIPKEEFSGIELVEGMELLGESEDGQVAKVIVKDIGENEVMVDFNHPYAGKTLQFDVEILEHRDATEDELAMNSVKSHCCCGDGHCEDHHEHKHDKGHECSCGGNCKNH